MRPGRAPRKQSSRGHVRVEEGGGWPRWAGAAIGALASLAVIILIAVEFVIPALTSSSQPSRNNRTWFEFDPWAALPDGVNSVDQIAKRLRDNGIGTVYLEGAAWLSDGALREGEYAAAFGQKLRESYPELQVLLWLRMSGEQIADEALRERAAELARKAVFDWRFDGVQLNGYAISNGNESYVRMVRALREAIGTERTLSLAAPPDRIPTDPDVPMGLSVAPELTWDGNYKQRVGLLLVDEVVIMAYAAGLPDAEAFEAWVAYQLESYSGALEGIESRPRLAVAIPTYDAAPGHDPEIESVRAAVQGIERGRAQMLAAESFDGIGLYIYSATDSREWAIYREVWLGRK